MNNARRESHKPDICEVRVCSQLVVLSKFFVPPPPSVALVRQSGRRRSAKLVSTFADRGGVTWLAQWIPTAKAGASCVQSILDDDSCFPRY